ncbi:nuclear transition protein 2 [Carlito syrichta]|uniref:Nuclear transition protein 2 n=1 Tax=Carlito syrichta TaxID=1868482 RepID=A0A3Q0E6T5_CARSF|nr:nuclear transition protein 2 [Carlito syrichta]
MDTKTQSFFIAHTQPHRNSRSQGHTCSHCSCHCQSCRQSCSWSRSPNQSLPSQQSQRPSSSLPPKHHRQAVHSHPSPARTPTHCGSRSKNRKASEGKASKRKMARRVQQVYRTKRQGPGPSVGIRDSHELCPRPLLPPIMANAPAVHTYSPRTLHTQSWGVF